MVHTSKSVSRSRCVCGVEVLRVKLLSVRGLVLAAIGPWKLVEGTPCHASWFTTWEDWGGGAGEGGPGVAAGSCERQVPTGYTLNVCVHPKFLCWTLTLHVAVFGGGGARRK